jgi:5-methylcytosine-specific restriction endonuclease McrA
MTDSGNAIINRADMKPLNGIEISTASTGFINLGPLSPEAVGEEILFTHRGQIFGVCIDSRYINNNYIQEMSSRVGSELIKIDINIPEVINPGDELFLGNIIQVPEELRTDIQYLATISPEPTEDSPEVSQVPTGVFPVLIQDLAIQTALPAPVSVEVTKINSRYIGVIGALSEIQHELPAIGETIVVTTRSQTKLGTLATYEADYSTTVIVNDAQYPSEEIIKVRVRNIKNAYITGEAVFSADDFDTIHVDESKISHSERRLRSRVISQKVPIDIEPPPSNAPITNEVVVTGEDADALTGRWNVQDEVGSIEITEGDEIEVEIQSICGDSCIGHYSQFPVRIQFDRAVPTELKHQSLSVLIEAIYPDRAIAEPIWVTEADDEFHARVIDKQSNDALATNEGRLVVIPNSPVISQGKKVLVGPSESSNDAVATATVSARPIFQDTETTQLIRLPNTRGEIVNINSTPVVVDHLPDVDSIVTLGVSEVNKDHIVPTVDALPEAHLPEEGSYISVTRKNTGGNISVEVNQELPLKLPHLSPTQETTIMVQVLDRRSVSLLVVAGSVDNNTDNLQQVYQHLRLAVLSVQQREYENASKHLNEASQSCSSELPVFERLLAVQEVMIRVMIAISDSSEFDETAHMLSQEANRLHECEDAERSEVDAFLSARESEIRATERLLTALDELQDNITSNLQRIAQVMSAKPPAVKAAEHLTMAEKSVTGTLFEDQIPSLGMQAIIQEFEESFPGTVDELQPFNTPKDNSDWLRHLVPEWIIDQTDTALPNTESGGNTWSRPATPETMGITPMTEIGTQTEPESSTGPTKSTGESPTTNLPKLQELRRRAERESSENPEREDVSSSTTTTSRYKRSSAVREYALARADGTCEACKKDAPFIKENGDPYLEVHHVNELSDGGADDPSIVGAVCPSCHKEIHYGKDGDELNEKLRERLQDGLGNVGVVDK